MKYFKRHIIKLFGNGLLLLVVWFIAGFQALYAQDNRVHFKQDIEQLIGSKPIQFQIIDSIFKKHSRDSTKMKVLISTSKAINYIEGENYGLNALGTIYRNISHYETSIETHKKANALLNNSINIEFRINGLNNIGVAYRRMDLVKPALDFHAKALYIASSIKNPSKTISHNISISQNSIGTIYLILEQYDLALKQFEKSLSLEKTAGNKLGLAINYQHIDYAYEAQGNLEKALLNYKLSLDYNGQNNSNLGRVICYNSIGQVYIKQKQFFNTKVFIGKVLGMYFKINDQFYIASSYINLGWVQKEMGCLPLPRKT